MGDVLCLGFDSFDFPILDPDVTDRILLRPWV